MRSVHLTEASEASEVLSEGVRRIEHTLADSRSLDPLMERIGDARFVLLGEASHGTSEYYLWRARLTQRLIEEKGFNFIAVEGDWPDCYRVNRHIKGYGGNHATFDVLHAFGRWPTWMWANWEVTAFVSWLRNHNDALRSGRAPTDLVGFYGLDVYSLQESMSEIMDYLKERAPEALDAARQAFRCFEPYGGSPEKYAWSTTMVPESCEDEVVQLLREVRGLPPEEPLDGDPEADFAAEQNAWVLVESEHYYRTMLRGSTDSWNVRDYHMADTLDRLADHYGPGSKAIVWEHNTPIGDARATDMARASMVNVGQIVRERHAGDGVVLVGFGSHRGTVIAAPAWGDTMEKMEVPAAQSGSWESILYRTGTGDKLLLSEDLRTLPGAATPRGHRAIGVVYDPRWESGNYVPTSLPARYDAFVYLEETEAVHALHIEPEPGGPPETFPWGV